MRILPPLLLGAAVLALPPAAVSQTAQPWTMPQADDPAPGEAAPATPPAEADNGDMIQRGIEGILQDMLGRAQPHLEGLANELQGAWQEYGPAFEQLAGLIDDIGNYHAPERLPNGDVLLRRRADAPPPPPLDELNALVPEGEPAPPAPQPPPVTGPQIEL